ncbi:hypothetical protein FAUST_9708 [Fusarium austroamericanum]|uniref:beta-glucosidase n=1 Tax=Fusarium austroamericanum TaxID=282268 RepID=A0AAN5Z2M9_FUSAU|nr:hypothetical protein FAUST_9708 [Fusarium austroamericanum]
MRPQPGEQLELVNRTVENLQDSLLRPSDELKDENPKDSCSSDDDATTCGTADTTLNDMLSGEARETPKSTYLSSDHGIMTEAPVISPPFKALQSTALRQNLSQIHSAASEDIDTGEDGSPWVAGCFCQTSPSQFPVLKVSEDDWNEGFHFGFGNTSAEGVVSFHIGLPETRQDKLPQAWKDSNLLIEGDFTTRRFSVILSPVAQADKITPLNLFRRSTLQVKKFKLLLHWDLMDVGTKAKVYHRLAKLESIYQKVETVHCEKFASQAPILDDRIVCITIPWKKYQQWTQGMSKDAALDALWEQGILATLPVLVSLRDGTLDPRVWCESKIKRHGRNVTQFNEKSVHAIFQEYTYNGLCFPEDHELCETRFIIVIHNTAQAHDWVDFIRRSQSKDPMGLARARGIISRKVSGGGSASITQSYINFPYSAFQQRTMQDGTFLYWDCESQDPVYANAGSDACIVFINEFSTEGSERSTLADPWSDQLVKNVASRCPNTIVSIHNAGIRLVDQWIDHPNVTAVLLAHVPGQDSGRSLAEMIYGEQSPSGRLPYTVAKNESDYGELLMPVTADNATNYYTSANSTEGVYIDYRRFDAFNITPRYEFGFGLSYTTFEDSGLNFALTSAGANVSVLPPPGPVAEGGQESLWDIIAVVSVDVKNTGAVAASAIPRLYAGIPKAPMKQLRGFEKVLLQPGDIKKVVFSLTRRDLSTWDVNHQNWVLGKGGYNFYVGASSRDLPLMHKLVL